MALRRSAHCRIWFGETVWSQATRRTVWDSKRRFGHRAALGAAVTTTVWTPRHTVCHRSTPTAFPPPTKAYKAESWMSPFVPFVGRSQGTGFRGLGDSRPDRVQIHVHAARQHGRFVQKALALEAALPKTSRAVVFPVRAPCNRLRQTTHQSRDARQPLPTFLQPLTVRHQHRRRTGG